MQFQYDKNKLATTDVVQITIADLRDLVQAMSLADSDRLAEVKAILASIEHKNRLEPSSLVVK